MKDKIGHQIEWVGREAGIRAVFAVGLLLIWPLWAWSQEQAVRASLLSESLRRGLELADAYNWSDAGPYFAEAEKEALGRSDQRSALYARIGLIRSNMEQRVLAETALLLANELRENAILQSDPEIRIFTLQIKGDIDFEIDAALAKQDWEEVLDLARKSNNKKWHRRASGELGLVAFLEGDILAARKLVGTALIEATMAGDVGSQVRYLGAIGTGLVLMKNFDEALQRLNQALAIAAKNPTVGYSFPTQEAKIQALSGLKRMDQAFSLAREVVREAQLRNKHVKEAQAYITMGNMAAKTDDVENAEEYFRSAARLSERGGFLRLQAGVYSDLANLKRRTGEIDAAERFATQAAELTQSSGDLYLLPDRLLALASVQIGRRNYVGAKDTLARATEAVDAILSSTSVASVRASLVHSMSAIFTENFLLHAKYLSDLPGAWEVLETSRARTTRDLLMQGRGRIQSSSPEISKLRLELVKAKTAKEFHQIREKLFLAETSQLTLGDNPLVLRTQAVSIQELQRQLQEDDLLLEYVLAEPASYFFAITRSSARLVELPSAKELDPLLSSYHDALQRKQTAVSAAQQLYQVLLGPARQELSVKKKILIARHGTLHLVPVESFVDSNGRYFVLSHTVTYVPSGTTYVMLQQRTGRTSADLAFLGVGGIPYDTSPLPKIAATRGYESRLGNLPGSAEEIELAAHTLKIRAPELSSTLLLGDAATESAFKNMAGKYRIIHLAVHAKANHRRPNEAALILLSDAKAGDDGFLQANEVLDLRLKADLVLLSACDTSVGKLLGEDGIANLARSFLATGAKTVVSTLWEAVNTFASTLIRKFYTHLGRARRRGRHGECQARDDQNVW